MSVRLHTLSRSGAPEDGWRDSCAGNAYMLNKCCEMGTTDSSVEGKEHVGRYLTYGIPATADVTHAVTDNH